MGQENSNSYNENQDPWPMEHNSIVFIEDVQLTCDNDTFHVDVKFTSPFYGIIYTKDYFFSGSKCRIEGQGLSNTLFDISFNNCGSKRRQDHKGVIYHEAIIVVKIEKSWPIITTEDRGFRLKCWPVKWPKQTTMQKQTSIDVPMIPIKTQKGTIKSMKVPDCTMKVIQGLDVKIQPSEKLIIGQTGSVVITYNDEGKFDMFLSNCLAHDGKDIHSVDLIDPFGCPTMPKMVHDVRFVKNGNQSYFFFPFKVFKFPDTTNVYFKCNITICFKSCSQKQCGKDLWRYKEERTLSPNIFYKNRLDVFNNRALKKRAIREFSLNMYSNITSKELKEFFIANLQLTDDTIVDTESEDIKMKVIYPEDFEGIKHMKAKAYIPDLFSVNGNIKYLSNSSNSRPNLKHKDLLNLQLNNSHLQRFITNNSLVRKLIKNLPNIYHPLMTTMNHFNFDDSNWNLKGNKLESVFWVSPKLFPSQSRADFHQCKHIFAYAILILFLATFFSLSVVWAIYRIVLKIKKKSFDEPSQALYDSSFNSIYTSSLPSIDTSLNNNSILKQLTNNFHSRGRLWQSVNKNFNHKKIPNFSNYHTNNNINNLYDTTKISGKQKDLINNNVNSSKTINNNISNNLGILESLTKLNLNPLLTNINNEDELMQNNACSMNHEIVYNQQIKEINNINLYPKFDNTHISDINKIYQTLLSQSDNAFKIQHEVSHFESNFHKI
ncbi:unnamed protein product [Gordionus sp. m RMFG-2023]